MGLTTRPSSQSTEARVEGETDSPLRITLLQGLPKGPPPTDAHPCNSLSPERPGVLSAGECSGTCMASSQRGKPCFYGSVTAHNCPLFLSRLAPAAPIQGVRARR